MRGDKGARRGATPLISNLVAKGLAIPDEPTEKVRQERVAALQRFLSGPKLHISEMGRMPAAEERNARL